MRLGTRNGHRRLCRNTQRCECHTDITENTDFYFLKKIYGELDDRHSGDGGGDGGIDGGVPMGTEVCQKAWNSR